MTILIAPRVPSEFASPDPTHNSDCGPCLIAGLLTAWGFNFSCHDVAQAMRDNGRPTSPGTFDTDLAWALMHFAGIGVAYESGVDLSDLDRGHYAIRLVQSNGQGHPVPRGTARVTHWIAYWGRDGDTVYVANPGPGTNSERYSVAYLQSCDLNRGLEVLREAYATPPEDEPLTPAERAEVDSLKSAVAQLTWVVAQGGRIDQTSYDGGDAQQHRGGLMGEIGAKGAGAAVLETLNGVSAGGQSSIEYVDTLGGMVRERMAANKVPSAP